MMKENDWLIASINNPNFEASDFRYYSDMNLNNTQFLPRDRYLSSQYILNNDLFKDNAGNFSNEKFNPVYSLAAKSFGLFQLDIQADEYEWSMWDPMRPAKGKIKNPNFNLDTLQNPDHYGISIGEFNEVTPSNKSKRELAQDSLVYDPATGTYSKKSLNEMSFLKDPIGFLKSLTDEPIVYATYDKDEEYIDPLTGKKKVHQKGEWKVNEFGEYYTEKLNGRSLIGKEVVSAMDYLTPENSGINKYDFFDSDDLDKSVVGTVAKSVALIAPMLAGSYVAPAYSAMLVGREMAKTLPMLYGIVTGLTGLEKTESKLANTIAAYGLKLSPTTSEYSKGNTFSFENIGNLMSEVALQWGQQRIIANSFASLTGSGEKAVKAAYNKAAVEYQLRAVQAMRDHMERKISAEDLAKYIGTARIGNIQKELVETGKWMDTSFGLAAINKFVPKALKLAEAKMRMGQDLSLVYMAMVSNTDVYDSVLLHKGTPFEAAAIALGSTIGMFSVDKYLGLGEMFFNQEPARKALREAVVSSANAARTSMGGITRAAEASTKKGILDNIMRGINAGKEAIQNYKGAIKDRSLGFIGKSLGEGLEEVSEELITDFSKTLGELAGKFGVFSQTDYGAWENAFDRYAMSFLGGSLGGGMFYGVDMIQNRNIDKAQVNNDLTYLLRLGKKGEILNELKKLRDNGKLGSTSLSFNTTTTEDNKKVFLTAENEEDSQNNQIYNRLVKNINQLDMILNENLLNLSEDELFDKMVLGDYRNNALNDLIGNNDGKGISYITRYQEDFQKLANNIRDKEEEILTLIHSTSDEDKRNDPSYKTKLEKLQLDKLNLIEYRDYLFGEGSVGYVEKMLFAMDTGISGNFVTLNKDQFARSMTGKSIKDLTESEKEYINKQYEEYSKTKKLDLDTAFKLFKEMLKQLNPTILELGNRDFSKELELLKAIIAANPYVKLADFNTKLDNDTDEEYENRATKLEGEDDEGLQKRILDRLKKVEEYNKAHFLEWIKQFTGLASDQSSHRLLHTELGILKKSILDGIVNLIQVKDPIELTKSIEKIRSENPELTDDEVLAKAAESVVFNQRLSTQILNLVKSIGTKKEDEVRLLAEIRQAIYDDLLTDIVAERNDRRMLLLWDWVRDESGINRDIIDKRTTYIALDNWVERLHASGNAEATIEDAINAMELWDSEDGHLSETQLKINRSDILDYYVRVKSGVTDINDDEGLEYLEVNDASNDYLVNEALDNVMPAIEKVLLETFIPAINNDEYILMLDALDNQKFIDSPILSVLDTIHSKIRGENVNIGKFLSELYDLYTHGDNGSDFSLTDDLLNILKLMSEDLVVAHSFIRASSVSSSYSNPVGHNKAINDYHRRHKDVLGEFEELPEIDKTTADFLLLEAELLGREMLSWINLSERNLGNKITKFITAQQQFNKALLEFFKINRDSFKVSPTLDLLKGYEEVDKSNEMIALVQIQQLLHNNFAKSSESITTILDKLVPNITDLDSLKYQTLSLLDETISYNKFTDYDRMALVVNALALSNKDFYNNLKEFISNNDNIAPIALLEYVSKLSQSADYNTEIINESLKWLKDKVGLKLPILENTTISIGVGGAGKSKVIAKYSCGNGENTWVSGPTDSLIDNLVNVEDAPLPKATSKSKKELLDIALGEDSTKFTNATKKKSSNEYFSIVTGLDGHVTVELKPDLKVAKITDVPKYIVIDEATHFNTAELLVISKFCKENGITLKLLGDTAQLGVNLFESTGNINYENVLAWRTPKLFISLRDANILKSKNLDPIIRIIDEIQATNTGEELEEISKKYLSHLPELHFYNGTTFAGELITTNITKELLAKLKYDDKHPIGVVSDNIDSEVAKLLRDAGANVVIVNPKEVLGREFDYVVVDMDWKLKLTESLKDNAIELNDFLKTLYTMISRSRKGTVIMDRGLSKIIRNQEDSTTSVTSDILKAIAKFRPQRLSEIDLILLALNAMETVEKPSEEAPKKSEKSGPEGTVKGDEPRPEPPAIPSISTDPPVSPIETMTTPARAYSEISFAGIDISGESYKNEEGSNRDLGILLRPGLEATTPTEKQELVRNLVKMKSIFNFGTEYWDNLDIDIRRRFSKDSFDNAEFYIRVEDDDSTKTSLVGMSKFRNSIKRADGTTYSPKLINGKVITLVAKIKDNEGNEYEITLGGVANPETWAADKTAPTKIRSKIEGARELKSIFDSGVMTDSKSSKEDKDSAFTRISRLKGIGDLMNRTTWDLSYDEIKARVDNILNIAEELLQYLDNLPANITRYTADINAWTSAGNDYHRINRPNFSGMTKIYNVGENLRLEDINSNYSAYDLLSIYTVTSEIYTPLESIPGLPDSVIGKPIMFVSANPFLNPKDLEKMYIALKNDPTRTPQVRLLILNPVGVSFSSLYNKNYKPVYTAIAGDKPLVSPFDIAPMGGRMYISAWNYRANLTKFCNYLNEWAEKNSMTIELIEDLAKAESAAYYDVFNTKKAADKDFKYLDEVSFRESCSEELKSKFKLIWEFNDSLSEVVRDFRLGYEYKHGAYIRKLTNLKEGGFYSEPDNTLGIYTNPSVAVELLRVVNALFEEIIDKIIPNKDTDILAHMDDDMGEEWFKKIREGGSLTYTLRGDDGKIYKNEVTTKVEDSLYALASTLIETAKFLQIRSSRIDEFEDGSLTETGTTAYKGFTLRFNDQDLVWSRLAKVLNGGDCIPTTFDGDIDSIPHVPGIVQATFTDHDGVKTTGYIDHRIDNMFSLMFHGLIGLEKENDFTGSDIRATSAKFKFGFFADPMIGKTDGTLTNAVVITNRKLFSVDAIALQPYIGFSTEPYSEENAVSEIEEKPAEEESTDPLASLKANINNLLSSLGITVPDSVLNSKMTEKELLDFVNQKINGNIEKYFKSRSSLDITTLPISATIKDNSLEFRYFNELEGLKGLNIKELTWDGSVLKIILDNGDIIPVQKFEGEDPVIGTVIKSTSEVITGMSLLDRINTILNTLGRDGNDMDSVQSLLNTLTRELSSIKLENPISTELSTKIVNKIQNELSDYEDDSDPVWDNAYKQAWQDLEYLKTLGCAL